MSGGGAGARFGVAVTRPGATAGRLGELLHEAGAVVTHWPCIRFDPPADPDPLAAAASELEAYDWVAVTSPRSARRWLEAVAAAGGADPRRRPPAAAAGPATAAELREAGWPVRRIADTYSAGGLVAAFASAGDSKGARILFPCSDRAEDELPEGLRRLGAEVVRVTAYRTVATPPDPSEILEAARDGRVDVVTFTSPSTVEGFLAAATDAQRREIGRRLAAAAIGPTTAAALQSVGWPAAVAEEATLESLVATVQRTRTEDASRT